MRRGIFEYKFWSTTHWATKLGQSKELNKAIIFRNLLNNLEDWDKFQVLFNLETCSIYSITNYVTIPGFHIYIYIYFEKVNKTFKNCKYQLLKMARFRHIVILIKSKKRLGISFQSPVLTQKHVRNVGHSGH